MRQLILVLLLLIAGCDNPERCPSCDNPIKKTYLYVRYYDDIQETHVKCPHCYFILERKNMEGEAMASREIK
jgi:hypothetical protein